MIRLRVSLPSIPSLLLLFYRDLERRGLVSLSSPPLKLHKKENALSTIPNILYAGFDPTANSFHVGNLLIISNLLRASFFGCKTIALIGGASGQIGDPSGRFTERKALSSDSVSENAKILLRQLAEISENASQIYGQRASLTIVNNIEWYDKMSAINFLQVGRDFRVGEMLRIGPIKARMAPSRGISFTEFAYPIFQAYDWYILAQKYGCFFQLGGSDQLGNFEVGQEYILKRLNSLAYGVCLPLITDEKGQKLGKSTISSSSATLDSNENRASIINNNDTQFTPRPEQTGVWLDDAKTSPFALYQYFRQLPDALAERLLFYYSLKPIEQLEAILAEHCADKSKWLAQTRLSDEIVELVHGKKGLELAQRCSRILFSGKLHELKGLDADVILSLLGDASTFQLSRAEIRTFGDLADRTLRDTRKRGSATMREGSFYVNGLKSRDANKHVHVDDLLICGQFTVISWGKRNHSLVRWI